MANSWFNPSGNPITRSVALSNLVRNDFASVGAAFDKLPDPLGAGLKGFISGTWTNATLNTPTVHGGFVGSGASPTLFVSSLTYLGGGTGYAAGALPVESGTLGALFRMATTSRVGYARSDSGTPKVSFFFDEYRSLVMGNAADENATSATEGFLYLPTCNGTPTGAPAAYTGAVPVIYDRSAHKIWVRYSGTWRQTAALT